MKNIDLKIILFTFTSVVIIFVIGVLIFYIGNFDNRTDAAVQNVKIPNSIYSTSYLLSSDQNIILSQNNNLKASLVNSINNLKFPTGTLANVIDLIKIDNANVYVSVVQMQVTPNAASNDEGYLSGQVYKFLYTQNKTGGFDYTDSENITQVRNILLSSSSFTKVNQSNLQQLDNLLYEGDTTLYQSTSSRAFASSISGVSFKLPWLASTGDWRITQSWHNSSWYLNGVYFTETALDITSSMFTLAYESSSETPIYAPISGTIQSRCNYDPYNNGYLVIKGDDGIYYSIIHLKVNTITKKTGDRILQGNLLGYLFEDGSNQDHWVSGQSTAGRCAWAQGTHIHIGAIPVNNSNLSNGIRSYNWDGYALQYPNNNGNASVGKILRSTTLPTTTTTSSSSTTTVTNVFTIKPKVNLNIRKCSSTTSVNGTTCTVTGAATSGKVYNAVCKILNGTNYWVRIDANPLSSTTNNQWVTAGSTYIYSYINNVEVQITDSRIPTCKSGV